MKKPSKTFIFLFIMTLFIVIFDVWLWFNPYILPKNNFLFADGVGFYMYLPSTFIYHDWNMHFYQPHGSFCISDIDEIVLRNPMGVSVLMFPFFLLAHIIASISEVFEADGFSFPYQISIAISALFYFILGLYFTYKTLLIKFEQKISLLSCLGIVFGCGMIFHATVGASYSHIYSFCLIAIFIFLTLKENKNSNIFHYFGLGILLGLIFLCRNINVLIVLFWLFYKNIPFKSKFKAGIILPYLIGFLIVIFPQLLYWKIQTGNFLVNTYSFQHVLCQYNPQSCFKEHFDWFCPHIIGNFFSYRKGLFFYYPVMVFAFLGILWLKKFFKEGYIATLAFLLPIIYLICSWSEWWYGFSFGQRPYTDYMSLFALMIGVSLEKMKGKYFKITLIIFYILILISFIIMLFTVNNYCNEDGSLILHRFY
ncbi:hypothetical protein IJ670_02815 [bacterium]|nr:hypothetical protein [bacterium]